VVHRVIIPEQIAGREVVDGVLHVGDPRHYPDAAAARREAAEPPVQPPDTRPILIAQLPPLEKHEAAGGSAQAIRGNLIGSALKMRCGDEWCTEAATTAAA